MQKHRAKRGARNDDRVERAVCDLFDVGRGFDTPENEPKLRFYTASTRSGRSARRNAGGKADVVDRALRYSMRRLVRLRYRGSGAANVVALPAMQTSDFMIADCVQLPAAR